jgi:hypothetical protein
LNFITKKHIIEPIIAEDFKLFRSPNQYSILMMSYGYQFMTDQRFYNSRDQPPQIDGLDQRMTTNEDERPFRFGLFSRFARELTTNH